MKLKLFQKQDLARAALHDGLILSWDTGLGKTWAIFLWLLLKVGHVTVTENGVLRVKPNKPVLIIAPGDLHQQIAEEGWNRFRVRVVALDSQETFGRLCSCNTEHGTRFSLPRLTAEGKPMLEPDFYITSYSQLTTNGVNPIPDAMDWEDPFTLLQWLCLKVGEHVPNADPKNDQWDKRPDFESVCNFFAWRGLRWKDEYHRLKLHPDDDIKGLDAAYNREIEAANCIDNPHLRGKTIAEIKQAYDILKNLFATLPCPKYHQLARAQQAFVVRYFCADKLAAFAHNCGVTRSYPMGPPPEGYVESLPETDTRPKWRVKCLYQPSLADLCYDAFEGVAIDEGVKMKGEETLVGKGVRSMEPKYRLVLTATPVKNRVPDIFRLAWWATGGKQEAHARFPYRDDSEERAKFASTFMVTERNLTKIEKAKAEAGRTGGGSRSAGREGGGRFTKLTAEVCNVHRLWKLLGPIVLRRRKDDCGEDIVPKIRKVIRCEMGTHQQRVYQYHLGAEYLDKNGRPAVGAQLQALRAAAADPSSEHLTPVNEVFAACSCRNGERVNCPHCKGTGRVPLPHISGQPFIPKHASTLTLISEILERKEQCVVFSAFTDPLDRLSGWLSEADVHHVKLDGRVSQKKRGTAAAVFKQGRNAVGSDGRNNSCPVMLAGVECMAEGHSFHLANNVILIAYSWAYDKFIQAINRVHRMTSQNPVNVYVVLCTGTIDRKLESLIGDKGDAAELVLDGRLIGERSEEVNLAELLRIAHREFDGKTQTIDEALLQAQWPALRDKLAAAMRAWTPEPLTVATARQDLDPQPPPTTKPMRRNVNIRIPKPIAPTHNPPTVSQPIGTLRSPSTPDPRPSVPDWRARLADRAARLSQVQRPDVWASL